MQRLNVLLHNLFALNILVRGKDKIVRVPARGKSYTYTPMRQIINHCPFFCYTDRIVQWQDYATSPYVQTLRYRSHGGTGDNRIGIESTKIIKVPFRRP